jgi:hypothetical protein
MVPPPFEDTLDFSLEWWFPILWKQNILDIFVFVGFGSFDLDVQSNLCTTPTLGTRKKWPFDIGV